ncbi:efflux RND transporter periplasmic adaptor subunit [Rariglobus hedericola]|uniref:Efflux RND transporter periplasmic adaptor subunit n=1 Tax=Rariglobus hedericola TaxID=2597822 RepID=A0A556QQW7_9BACT|nr:efflux RND transporter periplasmic adaptor subunit [Rariglobus hedericola]TSJ79038.1 efflux RND transporter periplasmic adaptor subunit [Rariglobus hedericola]
MKRLLWIVVALAVVAGGIAWVLHARASRANEVTYTWLKPLRRDLVQTVTANGSITPILSTDIRSEVSGRILTVLVNPGDAVRSGQPLIELDQSTLQVQIDEARLAIESSQLRVERATLEFQRIDRLANQSYVNTKEQQEAGISRRLAETDLESQRARMRLLERSLAKTSIAAPYDGTALSVAARPGMVVTGADAGRESVTLIELADLKRLRVELSLNEIDAATLVLGQPVEITFESVPEARASGRITFISPAAAKAAGDARTRDFPVQIGIEKSHPRVKPGMTARVHIQVAASQKALSVETTAVFFDNKTDETFVFIRPKPPATEPVKTIVKIGVRNDQYVEITDGLKETDEVSTKRPAASRPAIKPDAF